MAYVVKRACLLKDGSMTVTVAPAEQHPLRFTKIDGASIDGLVSKIATGEYVPQRAARIGGVNLYDLAERLKAEPDPVATGAGWIRAGAIPDAAEPTDAGMDVVAVEAETTCAALVQPVTGHEAGPDNVAGDDAAVPCKEPSAPAHATRPAGNGIPCHGANTGRTGCLAMMEDVPGRPRVRRFGSLDAFLRQLQSGAVVPVHGAMLQALRMEDVAAAMKKAGDARLAVKAAEGWVRDGAIAEPVPEPEGLVRGRIHVSFNDLLNHDIEWLNDLASDLLTGGRAGLTGLDYVPRAIGHDGRIAIDVEGFLSQNTEDFLGDMDEDGAA